MANFDNSTIQSGTAWKEIQDIVYKFVDSKEKERMEECNSIFKRAEQTKKDLSDLDLSIALKNKEIHILSADKISLESEIVKIENNKKLKEEELVKANEILDKSMKNIIEEEADDLLRTKKYESFSKDIESASIKITQLNSDIVQFNNDIVSKKLEKDSLDTSIAETNKKIVELSKNLTEKQGIYDELSKNHSLMSEQLKTIKEERQKLKETEEQAKLEHKTVMQEIATATFNAQTALNKILEEEKAHKLEMAKDIEEITKEKKFIEQYNIVMEEKNRNMNYVKEEVKKVIGNLSTLEGANKSELKNLMFLVEKL